MSQRISKQIKRTTKASVRQVQKLDALKSRALVSRDEKNANEAERNSENISLVRFQAQFKEKRGFAYIDEAMEGKPVLSWKSERQPFASSASTSAFSSPSLSWTIPIRDSTEIRKVNSLGTKSRVLAEWALDRQVEHGITLRTVQGETFQLTGMSNRDELFNRLISMGDQMWESW